MWVTTNDLLGAQSREAAPGCTSVAPSGVARCAIAEPEESTQGRKTTSKAAAGVS